MAEVDQLLDALNDADNGVRKSAETSLYALAAASLDALLAALVSTLCNATQKARKLMAAVQLRRLLSRHEHKVRNQALREAQQPEARRRLDLIQPATLQGLKAGLLHSFTHEADDTVRKNISAAMAEVAAQLAGVGCAQWPEVLQAVFDGAGAAADPKRQKAALGLLGQIVEQAGQDGAEAGAASIMQHAGVIGSMLQQLLASATVAPLARVAALSACARLLSVLAEEEAVVANFQALTPAMVATLEAVFAAGADPEGELAAEALCELTNIVQDVPTFFRPALGTVCTAMVSILGAAALEDETRGYALEFLVCLAESAGATVRKVPQLSETVFSQTLELIQRYEDADEELGAWGAIDDKDDMEDAEDGNLHQSGIAALARYASAIGAKQAWPIFQKVAAPLFANAGDWKARAAAVTAMAQVSSGCARDMALQMDAMVVTCERMLVDGHPRVAHAAARALETLVIAYSELSWLEGADEKSSELAGGMIGGRSGAQAAGAAARARSAAHKSVRTIQETCGTHLLPALVASCAPGRLLRVRSAAFSALDAFLGGDGETVLSDEVIDANANNILQVCSAGLGDFPPTFIQARRCILHCCGSIAVDMGEKFLPHYPAMQPALVGIVAGSVVTTREEAEIRSAAMFALANCMEAVGKQACGEHAISFLKVVLTLLASEFVPEDGSSMSACCDVLCKLAELLGEDFSAVLPSVLPLLVAKVQKRCWATKSPLGKVGGGGEGEEGEAARSASAGGGAEAGSSTSISMAFNGRQVELDTSILQSKDEAMKGLVALISSVGVTCKGFHGLVDQLYIIMEGYVLKTPEEPSKLNDKGLEMAPIYGDDLRYHSVEGLVEVFKVALADCKPHSSGLPHGQFLLNRVIKAVFAENGVLAKGAHSSLQETLIEHLSIIAQLSYESTRPGWKGPPGAEELLADVPAGTYKPAVLPLEDVPWMLTRLSSILGPTLEVRESIIKSKKDNPDRDEKDMEELADTLEAEDTFITQIVDIVGYCIKEHGEKLLPALFNEVTLPSGKKVGGFAATVLSFADKVTPEQAALRCAALCVADDLIEHAAPGSHQILPAIFPHMLECAAHENALLRHPALYGIGLCAQFAEGFFTPFLPQAMQLLASIVQKPDAREEDQESSTDNAVASLIKVVKFCAAAKPHQDMIMKVALDYLPLAGDAIEARLMSKWMIQGLRSMDPMWIGAGASRGAVLLASIARTLQLDEERREECEDGDWSQFVIEDADVALLSATAKELKAGPNAAAIMGLIGSLPEPLRQALAMNGSGF